jgi:hypothetical protein
MVAPFFSPPRMIVPTERAIAIPWIKGSVAPRARRRRCRRRSARQRHHSFHRIVGADDHGVGR